MDFSPDDLTMQIAEGLERYGKKFYESLALFRGNSGLAALAASLANAKEQHLSALRCMREAQPPLNRCRQLTEEELYSAAKELYSAIIFDEGKIHKAVLSSADPRKALDMAMAMETKAASFFKELAAGITGPNAAVLSRLADEENEHLNMLTKQRKRFFLLRRQAETN